MEIQSGFVAVVMPQKLAIYSLGDSGESPSPRMIHEFGLPDPFAYAALSFDHVYASPATTSSQYVTLRLLLTKWDGVRVYEALLSRPMINTGFATDGESFEDVKGVYKCCNAHSMHAPCSRHITLATSQATPPLEEVHVREIWMLKVHSDYEVCLPSFGRGSTSVSWLWTNSTSWEHMRFEAAYVPATDLFGDSEVAPREPTVVKFRHAELPALYAMAVRDQDETRGLTVFANAFGELTLYDFSGSDATELEQCFLELSLPALGPTHPERVSTVRVDDLHPFLFAHRFIRNLS